MKPYEYRFEKVLTYREQEKTETETEYKKAIDEFETVATELYELLKKKEDILMEQQERMSKGFLISDIHHYARFIESLEKRIDSLQQVVIKARSKMNWYEERLLEKTIEVKKFEKMKEKDKEHYRTEMEHVEANLLDELSTQKFHRRENGW
ncbi:MULTISPECIES: flagellar export protein FliJ [Sporosarcina]|uniref:Flagellar FliJ protein n=1 Tax=Sporosarcina contaminans TaxID=633403 RepID=A0ABW3TU26_9BACL